MVPLFNLMIILPLVHTQLFSITDFNPTANSAPWLGLRSGKMKQKKQFLLDPIIHPL